MHSLNHAQPGASGGGTSRPPFSSLALSAGDRLAAAAVAVAGLWLAVAWALDWLRQS